LSNFHNVSNKKANAMNSKEFTNGLLLGAVIGAAAGLLLAPAKGSDTLQKISSTVKDKLQSLKRQGKDLADEASQRADEMFNNDRGGEAGVPNAQQSTF
jgi:gas vesicle protein